MEAHARILVAELCELASRGPEHLDLGSADGRQRPAGVRCEQSDLTEQLKIWFGIIALITVELGLITPPVGLNVFIIHGLAEDVPMRETFRGVLPFLLVELVRIGLLLGFPAIVLILPRLLG